MKILLSLLLSGITMLSFAQIKKGDFLIKGEGSSTNTNNFVNTSTFIDLDLDIGYFINEQWMAGTGIDLSFSESFSFVGNQVFGRYYFKDSLEKRKLFFLEGRFEIIQASPIGVGQSRNRFDIFSGVLSGGLDYFISDHLAIEAQLDYYFINIFKSQFDNNRRVTDFLTFDIRLQYFFRYRDFQKERLIDYRTSLDKGTWFLGGRIAIHDRNRTRVGAIQSFRPLVGKFVLKNLAIGAEFNYTASRDYSNITLGVGPFSRYYFNMGRKKKLFVELKGNYELQLQKGGNVYEKRHQLNYGSSVGWSNFISKDVSFDIIYSIFQDYNFNRNFSEGGKVQSRRGLSFVLQYYL